MSCAAIAFRDCQSSSIRKPELPRAIPTVVGTTLSTTATSWRHACTRSRNVGSTAFVPRLSYRRTRAVLGEFIQGFQSAARLGRTWSSNCSTSSPVDAEDKRRLDRQVLSRTIDATAPPGGVSLAGTGMRFVIADQTAKLIGHAAHGLGFRN